MEASSRTKFILGGGLSGLVFAFYNTDYSIISTDLGGKLVNPELAATIIIHDTPETRILINDLGIDIEPRAHFVHYYFKGKLMDNVPGHLHQMYVAKKMTSWNELKDFGSSDFPDTDGQPNPNTYIPKFPISTMALVEMLVEQVKDNWINDKVLSITDKEIITESRKRIRYSDLVSTLPAHQFWSLYNKPRQFHRLPVTFVESDVSPVPEVDDSSWDLIYFVDPEIKYTRVNRNLETCNYLYEFTGHISIEKINEIYPELNVTFYRVEPCGVISTDDNNIPPPNIRFVGRFATWNHEYRIQEVIKDALFRDDFIHIWNDQKTFCARLFDYNVKDPTLQQHLTKEYVLHITDEAHELLSELHWKRGDYTTQQVNRKNLLEEWIDIFKFWLSIGNIWGFSYDEFIKGYWKKSTEIETKFSTESIERTRQAYNHNK